MKYSVIIPVYNSEKTLRRCVDSLLGQNYNDAEIILVNDGSSDASDEICREYAKNNPCIRYVSKRNGGVSSARNAGLDIASGEYILFVDSDDYVSDGYFAVLDQLFREKDYDYTVFSVAFFNGEAVTERQYDAYRSCSKDEFVPKIAGEIIKKTVNSPWNKVFKKRVIDELHLRFDESLSIGEDNIFNLIYLYEINSFCMIPEMLYHVCTENENSLSRKVRTDLPEQFKQGEEINLKALQKSSLEECYRDQYIAAFHFLKYSDVYSEAKRLHVRKEPLHRRWQRLNAYCKEVNSKKLHKMPDFRSKAIAFPVKWNLVILLDLAGWYLAR